eukprot:2162214-Pyramimonas_sp.AAC.1
MGDFGDYEYSDDASKFLGTIGGNQPSTCVRTHAPGLWARTDQPAHVAPRIVRCQTPGAMQFQ